MKGSELLVGGSNHVRSVRVNESGLTTSHSMWWSEGSVMSRMEVCGSVTSMSYDEGSDVLMVTSDRGDVRYMNMKGCDKRNANKKNGSKSGSVSVVFNSEDGGESSLDGVFTVCYNGKWNEEDHRAGW